MRCTDSNPIAIGSLKNITEEIWFKTAVFWGPNSYGLLLCLDDGNGNNGNNNDHDIYINSSGYLMYSTYNSGYQQITSSSTFNDNNWHFAIATMSSTTGMALYADGTNVGANANTGTSHVGYNAYFYIDGVTDTGPTGCPSQANKDLYVAETRFSETILTPGWINFDYHNMADAGNDLTFGSQAPIYVLDIVWNNTGGSFPASSTASRTWSLTSKAAGYVAQTMYPGNGNGALDISPGGANGDCYLAIQNLSGGPKNVTASQSFTGSSTWSIGTSGTTTIDKYSLLVSTSLSSYSGAFDLGSGSQVISSSLANNGVLPVELQFTMPQTASSSTGGTVTLTLTASAP